VKGWENPRGNEQPRELGKTTHNGNYRKPG